MTAFRVASLGAGFFGRLQIEAWTRIAGADLIAMADSDASRLADLPPGTAGYPDLESLLAASQPDILDIATPPATHSTAIATAIKAGVPNVICQKPFCDHLEAARQSVAAAEESGIRLIVHENFRFQPWYRAMRAAIDDDAVGDVLQASMRLRPGDGQGPDAYLARQPYFQKMPRFLIHETGVHFIDVFQYLFGPVSAVYADLHRINPQIAGEDAGQVIFDHPSGIRSLLDGNRHLDHAADNPRRTMGEMLIEGTKGTLTLTGDGRVTLRKHGSQDVQVLLPPSTFPGFGGDCVFAFQTHAIDAIRKGAGFETEAGDYLRVLEIEDAIYASAEQGRKIAV